MWVDVNRHRVTQDAGCSVQLGFWVLRAVKFQNKVEVWNLSPTWQHISEFQHCKSYLKKSLKKKISVDGFFVIFAVAVSPSLWCRSVIRFNEHLLCVLHSSVCRFFFFKCTEHLQNISQFFSNFPTSCFLCTPGNINQTGVRLFWSRMMWERYSTFHGQI